MVISKTIMFVNNVIQLVYYVNILQNSAHSVMLMTFCFSINVYAQIKKLIQHVVQIVLIHFVINVIDGMVQCAINV